MVTPKEAIKSHNYKKMAGTAAVFVLADKHANSPVERDGLVWSAQELHLEALPNAPTRQPALSSTLALEGLECYDPAQHGDIRHVQMLKTDFIYNQAIQGWIEKHTNEATQC